MSGEAQSYKTVVLRMVGDGIVPPGIVAEVAARYGYDDVVRDMLDRGAINYDRIARIGAEYGHTTIVSDIIRTAQGNVDYDYIAGGAMRGGYPSLAREINHIDRRDTAYPRYNNPKYGTDYAV